MKNIFKMMGLALVASSMMFVACSKDKEATYTATVQFGQAKWDAAAITPAEQNGALKVMLEQNAGQFPQVVFVLDGKSGKEYTVAMASHLATEADVENGYDAGVDYVLDGLTGDTKNFSYLGYFTSKYGDNEANYLPLNATAKVDAFDADDMELTATISAMMFDEENWNYTDLTAEQGTQLNIVMTTTMVDAE